EYGAYFDLLSVNFDDAARFFLKCSPPAARFERIRSHEHAAFDYDCPDADDPMRLSAGSYAENLRVANCFDHAPGKFWLHDFAGHFNIRTLPRGRPSLTVGLLTHNSPTTRHPLTGDPARVIRFTFLQIISDVPDGAIVAGVNSGLGVILPAH